MARIEKTVFISYRRTNFPWALLLYKDLTYHGYDAFLDVSGIAAGDFEKTILENIRARAHFLVLLTPSALERCADSNDMVRREIEAAIDSKRNIVPLLLEGFDFNSPAIAKKLTGKLAELKRYQAVNVPLEYAQQAMDDLRDRYLNVLLESVQHPEGQAAQKFAVEQKDAANMAPPVSNDEIRAQEWFERAVAATGGKCWYHLPLARDFTHAINYYNEAIRLKPDYIDAIHFRGYVRFLSRKNDRDGAIQDYERALELISPDGKDRDRIIGYLHYRLAEAKYWKADFSGARQDLDEAARLGQETGGYLTLTRIWLFFRRLTGRK